MNEMGKDKSDMYGQEHEHMHNREEMRQTCAYIIGIVAAFLMTSSFIPQVWKSFQNRRLGVSGVSVPMYCLFIVGVVLWFTYGVVTRDNVLIGSNSVMFLLTLFVLILTILPRRESVLDLEEIREGVLETMNTLQTVCEKTKRKNDLLSIKKLIDLANATVSK